MLATEAPELQEEVTIRAASDRNGSRVACDRLCTWAEKCRNIEGYRHADRRTSTASGIGVCKRLQAVRRPDERWVRDIRNRMLRRFEPGSQEKPGEQT